jgi:NADP-dependent 3-hydroxy acid dehydrogenase YdfG
MVVAAPCSAIDEIMQRKQNQRRTKMLLKDKVAVIYGAAGAIGGSVASTFAREGAQVFLTGRTGGYVG